MRLDLSLEFGVGRVYRVVDRVVYVDAVVFKDSPVKYDADGTFKPFKLDAYIVTCECIPWEDVVK